ncbi:MAG: MBL fold metallo-hydrolase [Methanothrix sp.]|jgi:7,8-dihydropterin-6-yl-methyl-4-(beta-D-ribofuranosyl)aminobenzene 5'-phosphate synthase|nr:MULTISPECIES: MBL fold metallo-hydrolase [Methanothrix]MBC7080562.1 MBL fold metallo-hydrolase [Methanothrix sp.]NPU87622.1 MBL fold metallo-hydrolase [Methanothrix sp.]
MVEGLQLKIVIENTTSHHKPGLRGQHGLSVLIEADLGSESMCILMDTGASSDVLLHNMDVLGIDSDDIDLIFLSHGHYDHTGGLMGLLKHMKRHVPILAHPGIFAPKLRSEPFLRSIGIPFTRCEAEGAGAVLLLSRTPVTLAPGIMTTGEVERRTSFERVEGFWTIVDGTYREDRIDDDQALVISIENRGLVVISGCAHSGIVNIVDQARRLTDSNAICAVIGGFHLMGSEDERIRRTAGALLDLDPEIVRPGHCTGSRAISQLQEILGDRCRPLFTGDVIEI